MLTTQTYTLQSVKCSSTTHYILFTRIFNKKINGFSVFLMNNILVVNLY